MTRAKPRTRIGTVPAGIGMAFLAVAIQVLLPFLVAYEIALMASPAYAGTVTFICSASGTHSQVPDGSNQSHHGLSDGCPLCTAMAAGQAFTTPSPVALPLPRVVEGDIVTAPIAPRIAPIVAAPYQSRAPPSSV